MSIFSKIGVGVLKLIPIRHLLKYLLGIAKSYVKGTQNKWDDALYLAAENLIEYIKFDDGIEVDERVMKFYNFIIEKLKKFDVKDTIREVIDYLHLRAKDTDTDFDDDLVETLEAILITLNILKDDKKLLEA